MKKIEFVVSGNTGEERAGELRKLYSQWKDNQQQILEGPSIGKVILRIIITDPKRETSVEHSVGYACGELKDGIVAAGGTIWDGTHVQITRKDEVV